jgi:hypothetical protein
MQSIIAYQHIRPPLCETAQFQESRDRVKRLMAPLTAPHATPVASTIIRVSRIVAVAIGRQASRPARPQRSVADVMRPAAVHVARPSQGGQPCR